MPQVQNPQQFEQSFLTEAKHATKRIYVQSLLFEDGDFLQKCELIFMEKARLGVDVHVNIDSIYKYYIGNNTTFFFTSDKADKKYVMHVHKEIAALIKRWSEAGIQFTFTNTPQIISKIIPIFRRNHTKLFIVDDTVWVGGINVSDSSFANIDFMVRFTDPVIVAGLCKQFHMVNENKPKRNYAVSASPHEVLIDAGRVGNSLIFDEATKLAQNARHNITFMSQFVPDGKLLQVMLQLAKQGVKTTVITRERQNFDKFPYNMPYTNFKLQTRNTPNIALFHQDRKVHAKLMIVDEEKAIFGSHNLVEIGVLLGTEEIAIKTTDTKLIEDLTHFVRTNSIWN